MKTQKHVMKKYFHHPEITIQYFSILYMVLYLYKFGITLVWRIIIFFH